MSRRGLAGLILVVWLVAIGWLVRREYVRAGTNPLADAAFTLPPSAIYFSLSVGGVQIGYASNTIDTLADTLTITDLTVLEIPVLGALRRTNVRSEAVLSRSLALREFSTWLRSDGARYAASGTVHGDSGLSLVVESDRTRDEDTLRLDDRLTLPSLWPLYLAFGGDLRIGQEYALRVFDPLLLRDRPITFTVDAESTFIVADSAVLDSATQRFVPVAYDTVHAWRIVQAGAPLAVETWIDDLGQVVQASSPVGYTMQRSAFEIAYENFRREAGPVDAPRLDRPAPPGNVVHQTAIGAGVRPGRPLASMRVRIAGASPGDLPFDPDAFAGDTLTILRSRPDAWQPDYRLPAEAREFGDFLRSEPLIPIADPRIRALARQIAGNDRRPERVARLLLTWVYENVEKEAAPGLPSALEVFETRRGDANEHAVLYVALARVLGLPARSVAGLTYLDGRFYYHAWPEVYLNGWVAVDPAFGQFPADASHVRFSIGGLAHQLDLIQLIGRLTIDVVDAQE